MNARHALEHSLDALCEKLRVHAVVQERECDLAPSVEVLRQAQLLEDSGRLRPTRTVRRLMRIAGANLSVARLMEGHVNALRLVEEHGNAEQQAEVRTLVRDGALLGVWGADGERPIQAKDITGLLDGGKKYASGLGTVTHAMITVDVASRIRLCVIDVRDEARQDGTSWSMSGMCATRSGTFDVTGIDGAAAMWVGAADIYTNEPGFISGVWRIAALQLGATLGLLEAATRKLSDLGRLEAEAQLARLAPVAIRALGAEGLVMRAAEFAESEAAQAAPEHAVALSGAARLLTEEIGLQAIAAIEQSLGLEHFAMDCESGRIARDLAVYMRQAARDALLLRAGRHLLADAGLWEAIS